MLLLPHAFLILFVIYHLPKVNQVLAMFPDFPRHVVERDLAATGSVEQTCENILTGALVIPVSGGDGGRNSLFLEESVACMQKRMNIDHGALTLHSLYHYPTLTHPTKNSLSPPLLLHLRHRHLLHMVLAHHHLLFRRRLPPPPRS